MTTTSELSRIWQLIQVGHGQTLELRAIHPKGNGHTNKPVVKHFKAAGFKSIDMIKHEFEESALELNKRGYNIYVVMNPISHQMKGDSASDNDIACRRLLLIDIDRATGTDNPATDAEIQMATDVADRVCKFMAGHGFPKPVRMMSGNGQHLYYPLNDLPNTPEITTAIRTLLTGLANKFDTKEHRIDTMVFNASRITKVPGTIARKGVETAERPYRMAVVV